MSEDLKQVQKKINGEWQMAFPQLHLHAQNKLYKIIGPVIAGLELIRLPFSPAYRPHFVIYPLWEKDVKASLEGPVVLKEFYNKKGLQFSIPYLKHDLFFEEVVNNVKEQLPMPFDSDVSLPEMLSAAKSSIPSRNAGLTYAEALLEEAKFKIALYTGIPQAQTILDRMNSLHWDAGHFRLCGADVDSWLQSLQMQIRDRDAFLEQIAANKQDKKIQRLPGSELIA